MSSNGTQEAPIEVRRICCVGAGYVGELQQTPPSSLSRGNKPLACQVRES